MKVCWDLCKAKVCDLEMTIAIKKQIFRFQVPGYEIYDYKCTKYDFTDCIYTYRYM